MAGQRPPALPRRHGVLLLARPPQRRVAADPREGRVHEPGTWFDEPQSDGSVDTCVGCSLDVRRRARLTRSVGAARLVRHDVPMIEHLLRLPAGPVDLAEIATDATPGFDGGKTDGKAALLGARRRAVRPPGAALRRGRTAGARDRRVLLVLQGMDTSGKGGVLRHTVGLVDPQGVRITSFKAPTEEERDARLPLADPARAARARLHRGLRPVALRGRADRPGRGSSPRPTRSSAATTRSTSSRPSWPTPARTIVKCMLHISAEKQKERLLARLDDPTKHWKFNPGDIDERARWPAYRAGLRDRPRAHQHRDRARGT